MIYNATNVSSKKIYCATCHNIISSLNGTYQSSEFHSIICPNCIQRFPADDIDLMVSLFYIYGGYYREKKETLFSLEQLITALIYTMAQEDHPIDLEEVNKKAMHQALLHGINPAKYIEMLESFFK